MPPHAFSKLQKCSEPIFRGFPGENIARYCLFTHQRHVISWAPVDTTVATHANVYVPGVSPSYRKCSTGVDVQTERTWEAQPSYQSVSCTFRESKRCQELSHRTCPCFVQQTLSAIPRPPICSTRLLYPPGMRLCSTPVHWAAMSTECRLMSHCRITRMCL